MSAPATTAPPFQALIDEHSGPVLAFLRSSVGPDDADDCLQETFLSALRAYPPADPGNLRGWLFRIARNKAIDRHRARGRAPSAVGGADELDLTAPDPAPAWLGGRGAKGMGSRDTAVWNAVAELPEGQRAAVVLRFAVDLRYGEIGDALDCSEAAARRRVHDGLQNLRSAISPHLKEATA